MPHQTSTAMPWTPANLSAFREMVKALILKQEQALHKNVSVSNEYWKKNETEVVQASVQACMRVCACVFMCSCVFVFA